MSWYDIFSRGYDATLEELYASQRVIAADVLDLKPGQHVLDLPTGTGASLPLLAPRVGPDGRVVAADLSSGMLAKAAKRIQQNGWSHVEAVQLDVLALDAASSAPASVGRPMGFDRIHVFLGLSTFPEWERAFDNLWSVLEPGGRMVVVDVHADPLTFRGRLVNLVARADIRRRTWEPLERMSVDFQRVPLPQRKEHGGEIFCATGIKPRK